MRTRKPCATHHRVYIGAQQSDWHLYGMVDRRPDRDEFFSVYTVRFV